MDKMVKQLSVFLENKEGALDEVLNVLSQNGINIVALSLADSSEYGLLRMIVSDPEKGKKVLKENGNTAMLTDVVALRVPHQTGALAKALRGIVSDSVNIEYMYAFANGNDAAAIIKTDNAEKTVSILLGMGYNVYGAAEAYTFNTKKFDYKEIY